MKATATPDTNLPASAGDAGINPEPTYILIVDDHVDTGTVMKLLLERQGFTVMTADSVRSARGLTEAHHFDLLISDIGLPDGTGLDVVQDFNRHHPVPSIALSGYGMEEDVQRSLAAGFHAHLVKPVSFKALRETIEELLPGRGKG